jgi:hypothetical protein
MTKLNKTAIGVVALFVPAMASAVDYSGLAVDLTGADLAMVAIGTAVLGALGVLLVIRLVKRAASA